jgi:hypothetical protein
MPTEGTLDFGHRLAVALLGVDRLYRFESSDDVGLVVLDMDAGRTLHPLPLEDYSGAARAFEALRGEARRLVEPDRRLYYGQVCDSTLTFIRWRSTGLPFPDQLRGFLHVPPEPASDDDLDGLRGEMRTLLGRMGYHGDLQTQCAEWELRNRVPPDEVAGVLHELMDEAWERTEELVLEIPALRSDGMRVEIVSGVPYNARCDYLNRTVQLNIDPVLTLPGLRHLTVHEAYPGHYVQFKLRETLAREGEAAADVLLSVVNTASSSVFEGIGDTALAMIQWDRSDDDRIQALMNRYRAGIGTGAAWRLHALGWPQNRVAAWLTEACLIGGEGWVDNRMRFIAAPERAVLIWSYWWGERAVLPMWRQIPPDRRDGFLRFLYGRMHSTTSIAMFEA